MKRTPPSIRKRKPIRRYFMTTVLLTTIIAILATSATGYFCIRWIRGATEETTTEQLESSLKSNVEAQADSVAARLSHYEYYIEYMTDTISRMYADEEKMIEDGSTFDPPKDTKEYKLTRAFASEALKASDFREELRFFSNLESVWDPIARENKDRISTIYLGTKDGLLVSYDRYSYLSVPPKGKETVYNYYVSEWYKRGMKEDGPFFTGVYMDSQGRGLTVTVASGFKDENGEPAGVVCLDFDLTVMYDELFASEMEEGIFTFAMDQKGTIISRDSDILDLQDHTGLSLDDLDELHADEDGIIEMHNSIYVYVPIESVGWALYARIPMHAVEKRTHETDRSIQQAIIVFGIIVVLVLLLAVFAVNRFVTAITNPLEMLRRDIKIISDGDMDYRASVQRNDEIGDISSGINEMVDRLNFTMKELISSQQYADDMSRLATQDPLTGIRNKTAFDSHMDVIREELKKGETEFGLVMVDLNNLKTINDTYGHERGDFAIKKLSQSICETFTHSPVFRVGGDEFVVIIKDEDYHSIDTLVERFSDRNRRDSSQKGRHPWEKVSAAIGYALYDENIDKDVDSVMTRADKEMYLCKKVMKGL